MFGYPVALRILPAAAALMVPAAAAAIPQLLPMPAVVQDRAGGFDIRHAMLAADPADPGASAALARFHDLLVRAGGPDLHRGADVGGGIAFVRDPSVSGEEAYRLDVTPRGATVAASGDAGLFYGAETLWQLAASAEHGRIAAVHIEDRPAFGWRGFMLDSARHFQGVDYIERQIDRMALAKLNVFHWHLTDDQGWRLQIDRYPRLTQVGAWRTEAVTGKRYGGFYTKADVRRVVAYAAARHITVVPEIEMPGHATALIASYPELASIAGPPKAPTGDWGILPNLLNPDDATFTFMENVLDEVMALFPGHYIHVGGDEAPKDQWKSNPEIEARMKALGLKDENALQGWFTARIADYLGQHGRRIIGWDEILEGKVPGDAVVMSWRGMDGAITAARAGHDTILAPSPILYLDNRQSDAVDETPGRGEIIDWRRLYSFDTQPPALTAAERSHILGVQANLWTEHAPLTEDTERMTWPRAAEAAELGWSPAATRDWSGFAPRLLAALARWDRLGWAYDRVPLSPEMKVAGRTVVLAQPAGIGTLRYTLDGSAPTATSTAYAAPLPWSSTMHIAAQAFLGNRPVGPAQRWTVDAARLRTRLGMNMTLCSDKLPLRLIGAGPAGQPHPIHWVDVMDACWRWPAAPTDGAMTVNAEVAHVPYNFALGDGIKSVTFPTPMTPAGELQIRQDNCDGPLIGSLPLSPAVGRIGDTTLTGRVTPTSSGPHDLCLRFSQKDLAPLWVIDRLTLDPQR